MKLTKKFDSQKCVLGKFATLKNFHLILKKSYFTNNYHTETIAAFAAKYHEILQKDRKQENTFSLICDCTNIYFTHTQKKGVFIIKYVFSTFHA